MDHGLELFIPILEILETEVCNIIYKPTIIYIKNRKRNNRVST